MFKTRYLAAPVAAIALAAMVLLGSAAPASAATTTVSKAKTFTTHPTPKITGKAQLGLKLTAKHGTWKPTGAKFTYKWRANKVVIAGQTKSTLLVNSDYLGKKITVSVYASKKGYASFHKTSKATKAVDYRTFADKNGTYKLGSKLPAGTYVAKHASKSCYWQRIAPGANIYGSIKGQEFLGGQAVVTLDGSEAAFKTSGCGAWYRATDIPTAPKTTIPASGDYLVGKQLSTGVWTASAPTPSCTWNLIKSFSGVYDTDAVPHDKYAGGPVTVTVPDSVDGAPILGFQVQYCGTWTRTGDVPAPAPAG